jgi:hypothetical protein
MTSAERQRRFLTRIRERAEAAARTRALARQPDVSTISAVDLSRDPAGAARWLRQHLHFREHAQAFADAFNQELAEWPPETEEE